ncbi:hypothetical protein ATANTOWER_026041 [Ataeniobius toweri]|uniref:Uncharacterized protein n=1 Tax=Ataeniobius toweri TaxID=208326 RepID=A0ABU7ASF9_9TELE|nr:hypothetical protein [Ataeniobius toweri]
MRGASQSKYNVKERERAGERERQGGRVRRIPRPECGYAAGHRQHHHPPGRHGYYKNIHSGQAWVSFQYQRM